MNWMVIYKCDTITRMPICCMVVCLVYHLTEWQQIAKCWHGTCARGISTASQKKTVFYVSILTPLKLNRSLISMSKNMLITFEKRRVGRKTCWCRLTKTPPMAPSIDFSNLFIGHIGGKSVQTSYPGLMILIFPHLFPLAKGHYSMTTMKEVKGPDGIIPEKNGGVASATSVFTFSNYCKHQLMNVYRHFGTDISFLFWSYDAKEKERIHSAARFTARKGSTRKKDVITTDGKFNMDTITSLPRTLKGSVEYKRSQYLDV